MSIMRFPTGLLVGAGLMYFLDPFRGRKRRARIAEAATHAQRVERELVGKAVRDAQHRVRGLSERVRHPMASEVSDGVLVGRARAALGRVVSHPSAIEIEVHDGRAIVRGAILQREADDAVRSIGKIPGIREVTDRLERHALADVPSLQGESNRVRRGRRVWPPAAQVGALGGGLALVGYGLAHRGLAGAALACAGGALVVRGGTNRRLRELLDRRRGIAVQKTIMVDAAIHSVFDLWSHPENFARFMDHVRQVEIEGSRSRWRVDGPAGTVVEFESQITRFEPDRILCWQTLPDQPIEHEGMVRFDEVGGRTRVHVQMRYHPPGGRVGHTLAHVLGWDPKRRMDDDLVRMKALLEDGRTRAHHQRVALEDLH
jgi:uncharacterized membrane protein